jgi:hypothetical protein
MALKTDHNQGVDFRLRGVVATDLNTLLEPRHPNEKNPSQS